MTNIFCDAILGNPKTPHWKFVKLSLHVNFCKIFKDEGLGLSLVREIGLFEGGRQISKSWGLSLPPVIVSNKDLGLGN